jgi:hypothetical protein
MMQQWKTALVQTDLFSAKDEGSNPAPYPALDAAMSVSLHGRRASDVDRSA